MIETFAPANISCIFCIVDNKDYLKRHSLGLGFTLTDGVTAVVKRSMKKGITVKVNGKKQTFPTVEMVIRSLTDEPISVHLKTGLMFGAGFGLSGASALSTAYGVNKLLGLRMSRRTLAKAAHLAEVSCGTGLGDVGGQYNGGVMVKLKRGSPLDGKSLRIPEKNVYYKVFSRLDTRSVITNDLLRDKINRAGALALNRIKRYGSLHLGDIIAISRMFAEESGLINNRKVKKLINTLVDNGQEASMIMLGNAVYSDQPFPGCEQASIGKRGA